MVAAATELRIFRPNSRLEQKSARFAARSIHSASRAETPIISVSRLIGVPSPEPLCASLICRTPDRAVSNAKSDSSSITAGDLVGERTRIIARLRWRPHELDPGWMPPTKRDRASAFVKVQAHVSDFSPGWWRTSGPDWSAISAGSRSRLMNSPLRSPPEPPYWHRPCWRSWAAPRLEGAKVLGERRPGQWIPLQGCICPTQRNCTVTGAVVESCATSTLTHRKPANQRRHSSDHSDPSRVPRTRPRIARLTPKEWWEGTEALRVLKRRLPMSSSVPWS